MFQHDVHTLFTGYIADLFRNFLFVVIDNVVGAEFTSFRHLLIITGGGNDVTVEEFRNLNSGNSDAGICAENQHRLSRTNSRAPNQHAPRGKEHQRNAGGLIEIQSVRNGNDSYRWRCNQFAIPAID